MNSTSPPIASRAAVSISLPASQNSSLSSLKASVVACVSHRPPSVRRLALDALGQLAQENLPLGHQVLREVGILEHRSQEHVLSHRVVPDRHPSPPFAKRRISA
jgi:hypothetical protein